MSPIFISSIVGVALSIAALSQIAPSASSIILTKNIEIGVAREASLVQQIIRYKAVENVYPSTVADLVAKNYWQASDNTNALGGSFSFVVNASKNTITVSTTIADASQRALYINNFRHLSKPVDAGGGVVQTVTVIPDLATIRAQVDSGSSIPVSSSDPGAANNLYWYDTSGATPVLKVSNGSTWTASASAAVGSSAGPAAPTARNILASAAALPVSATIGDVRYVYNADQSALEAFFYYNNTWVKTGDGNNPTISAQLSSATLPIGYVGSPFSFSFGTVFKASLANTFGVLSVNSADVTWSAGTVLPAGMTLSSAGDLTGTPTNVTAKAGLTVGVVARYKNSSAYQNYTLQVAPEILKVTSLHGNGNSVCGISSTGGVKCWGSNESGQLGNRTTSFAATTSPVSFTGYAVSGISKIYTRYNYDTVFADAGFTCFITTSGSANCVGNNSYGQLGNGTKTSSVSPVQVTGLTTGVTEMSTAIFSSCAVVSGSAKCWGGNLNGQLGNGTTTESTAPVQVTGLTAGVTSISADELHGCAVVSGAAKCWGNNAFGQLGNGTLTSSNAPVQVTGLTSGVTFIVTGYGFSCATLSTGAVKCWGANQNGQLGNGLTADSSIPVQVTGLTAGVTYLRSSISDTCAIVLNGGVKCWGLAAGSKFGSLNTLSVPKTTPVSIPGFSGNEVSALAIGLNNICVSLAAGGVKCWGENAFGQLGDGTTVSKNTTAESSLVLSGPWN